VHQVYFLHVALTLWLQISDKTFYLMLVLVDLRLQSRFLQADFFDFYTIAQNNFLFFVSVRLKSFSLSFEPLLLLFALNFEVFNLWGLCLASGLEISILCAQLGDLFLKSFVLLDGDFQRFPLVSKHFKQGLEMCLKLFLFLYQLVTLSLLDVVPATKLLINVAGFSVLNNLLLLAG